MNRISIVSLLLLAGLASGCSETMDSSETTSLNPTFMSPTQMTDYCRGEAAGRYMTRPDSVSVGVPQPGVGGGYIVTGSVDQGTMGSAPFECRFGNGGDYVSLTEL